MAGYVTYKSIIKNAIDGFNDIQSKMNSLGASYSGGLVPKPVNTDGSTILSLNEMLSSDVFQAGDVTLDFAKSTPPTVTISGTAGGFTASPSATAYYVTVNGSVSANGTIAAKMTGSKSGYIKSGTVKNGADKVIGANFSGNGGRVYIPAGQLSAFTAYATIAANITTPATNTKQAMIYSSVNAANTDTYVTVIANGSAQAKVGTAGYIPANTIMNGTNSAGTGYIKALNAQTITITGAGEQTLSTKDHYMLGDIKTSTPSAAITESTINYTAPSINYNNTITGFTASSSATNWSVSYGGLAINGSVAGRAEVTTAGWIDKKNIDSSARSISISESGGGVVYIPSANVKNGFVTATGMVSKDETIYTTLYDPENECVDLVFNSADATTLVKHGIASCVGNASAIYLSGSYAGYSPRSDALLGTYPFNECSIADLQGYADVNGSTKLEGTDKFLRMPNFYYYYEFDDNHLGWKLHVSNTRLNDNYKRVCDVDGTSWLYMGVYFADNDSSNKLRSRSGHEPAVSINQQMILDRCPYYANASGTGYMKACYLDYRVLGAFTILAQIWMGTRDSQSVYLGMVNYSWPTPVTSGWTYLHQAIENKYPGNTTLWKTGATDTLGTTGLISGEITSTGGTSSIDRGFRPFRLLGVENPWGCLWDNIYGIYHGADGNVYCDPNLSTGNAFTKSNYKNLRNIGKVSITDGLMLKTMDVNGMLLPTETTTDKNTSPYNDYYYYHSSQEHEGIFLQGGSWRHGSDAGLAALSGGVGFGFADVTVGARLALIQ